MSKQKKPAPEQPHHVHHQDDELAAVKAFMESYARPFLIAIVAVAVAVIALHISSGRAETRRTAASRALADARSIVELEDIVNDYSGTPSAPLALLALGRLHYDQGDYVAARSTYQRFLDGYASHALVDAAELGRLHAIEAAGAPGALTEAATGYERFITTNPGHYLKPQAVLGLARVQAAQGDREAARARYESFMAEHPESPWLPHVESRLEQLDRRPLEPALAEPAPPVTELPMAIPPVTETPVAIPGLPAPGQDDAPDDSDSSDRDDDPAPAGTMSPDDDAPAADTTAAEPLVTE